MGILDKIIGKSAEQIFIEDLKRGKSEEQKKVIDFMQRLSINGKKE